MRSVISGIQFVTYVSSFNKPNLGMMRYNEEAHVLEFYDGNTWIVVGSPFTDEKPSNKKKNHESYNRAMKGVI